MKRQFTIKLIIIGIMIFGFAAWARTVVSIHFESKYPIKVWQVVPSGECTASLIKSLMSNKNGEAFAPLLKHKGCHIVAQFSYAGSLNGNPPTFKDIEFRKDSLLVGHSKNGWTICNLAPDGNRFCTEKAGIITRGLTCDILH